MPNDGEVRQDRFHLYCTDPTDGVAKFSIVAPSQLTEQPQASDPRTSLGVVAIAVDHTAPPLVERLELDVEIDEDLILSVSASSSQRKDQSSASYFDLEFGIGLPGSSVREIIDVAEADASRPSGGLSLRTNVADMKDTALIPGDVLYKHHPGAFARLGGSDQATQEQLTEHLYYQPCAVCKRQWGDPACRCASVA